MSYNTLKFEQDRGVALITLNRPEKRNAISPEMIRDLHTTLDQVESGRTRVAVLTGAGNAFCAGMDLAALRAAQPSPGAGDSTPWTSESVLLEDARRIAQLFRRLYTFPKPLIAAVGGPALAGGCGIATLCDFTIACYEARFGYTEVCIGFIPALVAVFLVRQIGEKRARDLLLSGRILNAEEACRMGLVNEVVPQDRLLARAQEVARNLAGFSLTSLTHTKRLIVELASEELDRQLEISIQASARIRSTPDFREGLSAFLEKRQPQWESS